MIPALILLATTPPRPLKVYILAGQSNMQGHANVSTIESLADDPKTASLLKDILDQDGKPKVFDHVWVSSLGCGGNQYSDMLEKTGRLTTGFGASEREIGPELTFGATLAKASREPILLIKTAWGGRSLITDFRPPSGGPRVFGDYIRARWKERKLDPDQEAEKVQKQVGVMYHAMIDHVRRVLSDVKRVVPEYDPKQGVELAGFVWFQGFNDLVDDWSYHDRNAPDAFAEYGRLMADLIRDVRHDLKAPKMPVVIGVIGVSGLREDDHGPQSFLRRQQASPTLLPEFKGNVVAVRTAPFWVDRLESLDDRRRKLNEKIDRDAKKDPTIDRESAKREAMVREFTPEEQRLLKGVSNGGYHYLGAARILAPIGKAFADALLNLRAGRRPTN